MKTKSGNITGLLNRYSLNSLCQSVRCPNRLECWSQGTATFMVMGEYCTRACRFCSVKNSAKPPPLDQEEPERLAKAVSSLELGYIVLTSVTRDDLKDGGAEHFAECIKAVKKRNPKLIVEALIPDFRCERSSIKKIVNAKPDVVSHNIETVERLTRKVRDIRAGYRQSLEVLRLIRDFSKRRIITKSGLMVGLGENSEEVKKTLADLRSAGVELVTVGQYLRPSAAPRHMEAVEAVNSEKFKLYEKMAYETGFSYVACGHLVRSSYRAADPFLHRFIKSRA